MTLVARLSTLLIVILLAGCSQEKVQVIEGSIYGTTYSVKFTENINKEEIHTLVKAELDRIDMVFSTYKEDSMITRFNHRDESCITEESFGNCLSEEFLDLLWLSDEIHIKSEGAFNPFLNMMPPNELAVIRGEGDYFSEYNPMFFYFDWYDPDNNNPYLLNDVLLLDFSAVGKGYAVDRISALLFENGISNYFIDIGGEVSINGTKFEEFWTWGINNPFDLNIDAYRAFNAPQSGISIATSGEYRNPGHIWGEGPKDGISVTVIHDNTTDADAWATAMYVLGIEKGLKIAEKEGLAVFFIKNDGKTVNSSEWSKIYP
tara:strand:+ start:130 stop:1083 length:954 start_codon:yes stop_codon:yes gene_type:complete